MRFLSLIGNSFGCSASGERLVSAARDGDLQEAKALLEYNPRLVRYSTFGVRNSPLHYSAAQGHHEIVSLLVESGVDINLRNYRGQDVETDSFDASLSTRPLGGSSDPDSFWGQCRIHRSDYLNGGTALHLAALNGHSRCIRILLSDYIPSIPNCWSTFRNNTETNESIDEFDRSALHEVINRPADGGITALHMAALNGHVETVQLLLDLGASVTEVTVEDGTTIDLIGAGSTALHYAACGGNALCCQLLVSQGASLTSINANGWTPLMVARSWHRNWLEDILDTETERQGHPQNVPSPYICLPLMSIVKIARECGWRGNACLTPCRDPCAVCLERKCTVAAEGCGHEFCTSCALYLCSTNTTANVVQGPQGSIPCPLCRHGIVFFKKLRGTCSVIKETARTSLSLSFCTCSTEVLDTPLLTNPPYSKPFLRTGPQISPVGSSFRSLSCNRFPSSLCMGGRGAQPHSRLIAYCRSSGLRRSTSQTEGKRSWFSSLNHCVTTGGGC